MGQKQEIIRQADQCVKCGLCLPHCPTYKIKLMEGYSPRGRISLMQGLAQGELRPDDCDVQEFLDTCLGCRYCETVCPSKVEYSSLLNETRVLLTDSTLKKASFVTRLSKYLLLHGKQFRGCLVVLWGMQRLGLLSLVKMSWLGKENGLQTLVRMLPQLSFPKANRSDSVLLSSEQKKRGCVSLFVGCLGDTLGDATLLAGVRCLQFLGYQVVIPKRQGCCGLLHRHQGDDKGADALVEQNRAAFVQEKKVLTLASGCQSALREYPETICKNQENIESFAQTVQDIGQFLVENHRLELLGKAEKSQKTPCHIFVHKPCTQQYMHENGLLPFLEALPDVTVSVATDGQCCGAAGSSFLTQPALASKLAENIIREFIKCDATVFLSSNIGCELHFRAQLSSIRGKVQVMHPLQFLMERLGI